MPVVMLDKSTLMGDCKFGFYTCFSQKGWKDFLTHTLQQHAVLAEPSARRGGSQVCGFASSLFGEMKLASVFLCDSVSTDLKGNICALLQYNYKILRYYLSS